MLMSRYYQHKSGIIHVTVLINQEIEHRNGIEKVWSLYPAPIFMRLAERMLFVHFQRSV